MAEEINEPEEMFQSWDGKPIYAKKAERDVNGNPLELTIENEKVIAIGGVSVGGGGEPVDAYTKAETNELLDGKQDELPASSASQFLQTNSNNEIIWGALPSSLDEVAIFKYGSSIWVSEISDAYDAGKAVFCSKGQALLPLQTIGSGVCSFNGVIGSESTVSLSNIIVAHVKLSGHGSWEYQTITIPKPSQSDSGKVLTVNNLGAMVWDAASLPVATESDSVLYTAEPNGEASWAQMEKTVYGSIMTDEEGTPILDEEGNTIQDEDTATLWTGFNGNGFGAERAVGDENGNNIVTTYATKADVETALGDIETLLAAI